MAAVGDNVTVNKTYGYGDGIFLASPDAQFRVVAQYPGPAVAVPGAGMPYRGAGDLIDVLQAIDIGGNLVPLSQFSIEDANVTIARPGP